MLAAGTKGQPLKDTIYNKKKYIDVPLFGRHLQRSFRKNQSKYHYLKYYLIPITSKKFQSAMPILKVCFKFHTYKVQRLDQSRLSYIYALIR